MSDLFFHMQQAYTGYGAWVARRAVLCALFGRATGNEDVIAKTLMTLTAWRDRVDELVAAGALMTQRSRFRERARNCPPAFATTVLSPIACDCTQICPFCYARDVIRVWHAVDGAFADVVNLPEGRSPFWVLERVAKGQATGATEGELIEHMRFCIQGRRLNFGRFHAIGGYGTLLVTPAVAVNTWNLTVRQLFKVPAGLVVTPGDNETIRIEERPTRVNLAAAVSRTCRYPKRLLRGPIDRVRFFLDAKRRGGIRSSALLGDFRGAGD